MRVNRWWAFVAVASLSLAGAAGAETSVDPALERYGKCLQGMMGQEDETAADPLPACQAAASAGIPGAQYALAVHLLGSDDAGAEVDPTAIEWLRKAEASGHPGARFALAILHSSGRPGIRQDRDKALRLLRESYCQGYPEAVDLVEGSEIELAPCPVGASGEVTGRWRGSLSRVYTTPGGAGEGEMDLLVEVGTGQPRVFNAATDELSEIKPGAFVLREESGTAVVQAVDTGWDFDGRWVESWTLYLERLGPEEVQATFVRKVNNVHVPADVAFKEFVSVARGKMVPAAVETSAE